ncbi:metal ABC transporter substrate-binding protein [Galactobacter valiniphilus]|uniref:metal ABC transporter substrate-binding protein n=1 Tax=Galactobacter valiniphilus TaxID=2676122 RepID=UPI0037364BC4
MKLAPAPRRTALAALATAGALVLSACGAAAPSQQQPSTAEGLRVVASTTVYSSLVSEVLGDRGEVEALISSAGQDPHSYEASARDKLKLSKANLVVLNGGGYDAFAEQVVDSLAQRPPVLEAFEGEGHSHDHAAEESSAEDHAHEGEAGSASDEHADHDHADHDHAEESHAQSEAPTQTTSADADHAEHEHGNEHVWYDLHLMKDFAGRVGDELAAIDPAGAAGYRERAAALAGKLGGLEERVEALQPSAKGRGYLMTEPVAQSLLEDAGLTNKTPEGLAEAIEEGDEISPLALKRAQDELRSGSVTVLAYNEQTTDEQTTLIKATAEQARVHVLSVSETPGADEDYLTWMGSTIDALEGALK